MDDSARDWLRDEIAFRTDAPIVEYRHEVAHSAQHSPDAVRRAPERAHLWELMALLGSSHDPLEMTYASQSAERMSAAAKRHREGFEDAAHLIEDLYDRLVTNLDTP